MRPGTSVKRPWRCSCLPAGMHLCQRLAAGEQMVVHRLLGTLCIARLEPGHDQPVLGQRLLQAALGRQRVQAVSFSTLRRS